MGSGNLLPLPWDAGRMEDRPIVSDQVIARFSSMHQYQGDGLKSLHKPWLA